MFPLANTSDILSRDTAWLKSFTLANIQGGFAKTGIWPFSLAIVLDTIKRRPETPLPTEDSPSKLPPTPLTSKSICWSQKAYKANLTKENLDIILWSQQRLAAQHEIDKHIKLGLLETLKIKKKRRARGKRLNLVGKEASGAEL